MKRVDIIVNLGSPSEMTEDAAKTFLYQFLSDPFVLPLPFPFRNILAETIAKKRAGDYLKALRATMFNGQYPIVAYTESLAKKVGDITGRETLAAYRYGKNSVEEIVGKATRDGADTIAIIPAFPQNAKPTTQSIKAVVEKIKKKSKLKILFRESYFDHPLYIESIANAIQAKRENSDAENPREDKSGEDTEALIFSFHSLPLSGARQYAEECEKTARLICEKLGTKNALVGWQSKMGRGKWLEPSTQSIAKKIAIRGVKSATVVCAGFSTDCTETLIEIDNDLRKTFLENGGKYFNYIPCLNDSDAQAKLYSRLFEEMI